MPLYTREMQSKEILRRAAAEYHELEATAQNRSNKLKEANWHGSMGALSWYRPYVYARIYIFVWLSSYSYLTFVSAGEYGMGTGSAQGEHGSRTAKYAV